MKYAIIAAGEGSRLASEGIESPKPLVCVNGERLVDRLIRVFMDNGATEILVICNNLTPLVARHLESICRDGLGGRTVPLRYVVKTTPSSMHSLYELSALLGDEPFVLTTVDTIFSEDDFRRYVEAFEASDADGMMGVTSYIDDEKPLYVGVDNGTIDGFYDEPHGNFISGGIYGLTSPALATLRRCVERGEQRMRNFQRALIRDGLRLEAFPFSKVLDVDHASDVAKAEQFLSSERT